MNPIRQTSQRGVNVVALLCALVLLTALAIGAKFYGKKVEAQREAERKEQALKAEAAREAQERLQAAQQEEFARQAAEAARASTSAQLRRDYDSMIAVARKWDDAVQLGASTPRYALPQVILQLQTVRREMEDLKLHECMDRAKKNLVTGMDGAIQLFEKFLRNANQGAYPTPPEIEHAQVSANLRSWSLDLLQCRAVIDPPRAKR